MSEYTFTKFSSVSDGALTSKARIEKEKGEYLSFGVDFLDDALIGICKNDLIVLGGRSGGGKTELATHIAMTNALKGKRVYFFALEAEDNEISDRIKFKILSNCYFNERTGMKSAYIAYDRWKAGMLGNEFDKYEDLANDSMRVMENLFVRYGSENYTIENYENDLLEIKDKTDLVIIDHLHYFDIDETQANAHMKNIVKKIKAMAIEYSIPVILVAHIRKQDKRYAGLVPDQEDFHGSSDIIKIATKSITIASGMNKRCLDKVDGKYEECKVTTGFASFVRAVKNRRNGSVMFTVGLLQYDPSKNSYIPGYYLGDEITEKGESCFLFTEYNKMPMWALRGNNA